jgi:BirA family biotin operon repressor/biotin-[acetyl-CoA-carboxylase] ligase
MVDNDNLLEQLLAADWPAPIAVMAGIDSTNGWLLSQRESLDRPCLCLALEQHAGRGRNGRSWSGSLAGGLYLSLLWRFDSHQQVAAGLSIAIGVALRRVLGRMGVDGVELKWPNDLLLDGGKLGGVLVELASSRDGGCDAVMGVGINCRQERQSMSGVDQRWSNLADRSEDAADLTRLAPAVASELVCACSQFAQEGVAPLRDEWFEAAAFRDREVSVGNINGEINGRVVGIDRDGALLLVTRSGLERCIGGDLSLRERDHPEF